VVLVCGACVELVARDCVNRWVGPSESYAGDLGPVDLDPQAAC